MYRQIILLIILTCIGQAKAQPGKEFTFTHFGASSGLLSNQINTVVQDKEGYMWIGGTDGLQRFDGIRYKSFRHKKTDTNSIPSNPVLQLLTDIHQNLWLLTASGQLGIFDTKNFVFKKVRINSRFEFDIKSAGKRLITDAYGNIYLLVLGHGLLTYNKKLNELSEKYNFFQLPSGSIYSDFIQQPGTRKYWAGLSNGGVAIYNQDTRQLSYPGHNTENEPAVNNLSQIKSISNLMFDSKGRLWFDNWAIGIPNFFCYDLKQHSFKIKNGEFHSTLKTYHEIKGFTEQKDGSIWVKGYLVFGLFDEKENKFNLISNKYHNERSISYQLITCLYEDREKNIWIATGNEGLFLFNPAEIFFTNIGHTERNTGKIGEGDAMSFMRLRDGSFLVGIWGDGIYRYDSNFQNIPLNIKGIPDKNTIPIWSMCTSADTDIIWFGAQPGFYRYNQKTGIADFFNPPVLENRTIHKIVEDKKGNLWLSVWGKGLFKWTSDKNDPRFENNLKLYKEIAPQHSKIMALDSKSNLWVATSRDGLFVINTNTGKIIMHFGDKETADKKIPQNEVSAVLEYNDSLIVITTLNYLTLYNTISNEVKVIGDDETISGFIASLEKDQQGYMWMSTTSGLYRVSLDKRVFALFNRNDGIKNDFFTHSASYKLKDGRMIFGAAGQFIVFNPASIQVNKRFPIAVLTDFKVMNKSMLVDSLLKLERIELSDKQNSIEIDFAPLTYRSNYIIRYKLEGLDKDWKIADKNYNALYSYLPAGNYTFIANAEDAEGRSSTSIIRLSITVMPPFWKTWWFYSLLILVLSGLLFWYDKERMKRKEAIQKMRSNIADNLHEEINTALNNINILSEMARIKADKEPVKSKEYIEQIHHKSHQMIIAMDDMLWSIDPSNDSMPKTVDRMAEFLDSLNNRHNTNLQLDVEKNVTELELNMKLRHESFLLFKAFMRSLVETGITACNIQVCLEKNILSYKAESFNTVSTPEMIDHLLERTELRKRCESINATGKTDVNKKNILITIDIPI